MTLAELKKAVDEVWANPDSDPTMQVNVWVTDPCPQGNYYPVALGGWDKGNMSYGESFTLNLKVWRK